MKTYQFIKTKDGSFGLFDNAVNDIYHAREGAYSEACEKFALPAIKFIKYLNNTPQKIQVTDICYGIGYNTIAFLNNIFQNVFINKITINALEFNSDLISLSPFVKDNNCSFVLRKKILNGVLKYISADKISEVLECNKDYINYTFYKAFKGELKFRKQYSNSKTSKRLFLHNTYYNYISFRFNNPTNINNIRKIKINYYIDDARKSICNIKKGQNIVFLDAFDAKKLPTLWTQDFFEKIFSVMDENSKLFTYSHAASVRSGMLSANFKIGKNNNLGTVATKNEKFIFMPLNEYELGLLKTNAGVCFRDYNLMMSSDDITQDRLRRVKSENRESSTHYAKTHQK